MGRPWHRSQHVGCGETLGEHVEGRAGERAEEQHRDGAEAPWRPVLQDL